MRELNIGEKQVRVRATAPALYYYRQEFKRDLVKDLSILLMSFLEMISKITGQKPTEISADSLKTIDASKFDMSMLEAFEIDMVAFLQLIWAMAKADSFNKPFPSFVTWLHELGYVDIVDPSILVAALEEAADGFFRGGKRK